MIFFTMTVVIPAQRTPYVFLKPFSNLDCAIEWAKNEINIRDAEYILIREGEYASDPIVWDSRKGPAVELPVWTHCPLPENFPLREVNKYFEKRAASILGDYGSHVDFSVWRPTEKEGFRDYRYKMATVRTAWMMYLDLAIQWHNQNQLATLVGAVEQIKQVQDENTCAL